MTGQPIKEIYVSHQSYPVKICIQ